MVYLTEKDPARGAIDNVPEDQKAPVYRAWDNALNLPQGDRTGHATQQVDSEAMKVFADGLRHVEIWLRDAEAGLENHAKVLRAGSFKEADDLAAAVIGDPVKGEKLVTQGAMVSPVQGTRAFLRSARDAVVELQRSMAELAALYAETENFTDDQAKRLQALLGEIGTTLRVPTGVQGLGQTSSVVDPSSLGKDTDTSGSQGDKTA